MEEYKSDQEPGLMPLWNDEWSLVHDSILNVLSSVYDHAIANNITNINYSYPFDDESSFTLLELAIDFGNIEIINYIFELGADPNLQDEDGMTPLHYAISHNKSIELIKCLIDHGANLDKENKNGYSSMFYLKLKYSEIAICDILSRPNHLLVKR